MYLLSFEFIFYKRVRFLIADLEHKLKSHLFVCLIFEDAN